MVMVILRFFSGVCDTKDHHCVLMMSCDDDKNEYLRNDNIVIFVCLSVVDSVYNDYISEKKANIMLMAFPAVFLLSLLII